MSQVFALKAGIKKHSAALRSDLYLQFQEVELVDFFLSIIVIH